MSFPGTAIGLFSTQKAISTIPTSTFDPKSISGLLGWYKADEGVVLNGSTVLSWQDLSGNNNHLIQNVASQQPSLKNNALNILPAISFPISRNKWLDFTTGLTTQSFSIFCIIQPGTVTNGANTILGSNGGGFQYLAQAGSPQYCNKTFVVYMGGSSSPMPNGSFSQINIKYSSPELSFRLNKAADGTVNTTQSFSTPSLSSLGRSLPTGNENFVGDIVEVLIYPALTLPQI